MRYPGWAHLWAVGWVAVGSVPWLLSVHLTGSDDTMQPLRDVWHLWWVFVFATITAMLAQLVVPLLALLRRDHPWLIGLVAAALAAVPVLVL
jgi:hypothetical protein